MRKQVFFPSMLLDSSVIECKLVDLPVITNFPTSSAEEWTDYRHYGLRSADAYILVFDMCFTSSFKLIQNLRHQISASRDLNDIPIIVAANKSDLVKDIPKQDVSTTVRKTWHSRYVECSAKYNLNIATIFKEVTREVIKHKDGAANVNEEDRQQCCRIFR